MIAFLRSINTADKCQLASLRVLLVAPDLVRPHVRRIEIRLGRVEDCAVDRRLRAILVVLDIHLQTTGTINAEDVSKAGVVVKWIGVHVIRCLFGSKEEYGTGFGGRVVGLC